jgi:hypothetical protein
VSTPAGRAWRVACPNCGAPVEFRSAASASAVCSFCRSTLVREGDALRRIGQAAELFDDHSPLQLGASGRLDGIAFTLIGRLQYGTDEGPWNEWRALFDNGRDGWLSEDNGRYVFAFDLDAPDDAPAPDALGSLRAGLPLTVGGRRWSVASVVQARLIAAEGELRAPPPADRPFVVVDVRNTEGEVGTLDATDPARVHWAIGRSVSLAALRMAGLREESVKTLKAQAYPCPSCGAALNITLATTKSVVCGNCKAVVDLSKGIGPDMAHYAQANPHEPPIALGTTGRLATPWAPPDAAKLPWQVVGYQERVELAEAGEVGEAWREYLLYNPLEGFAFLVDTNEGWSLVRVLTGAPEVRGERVQWEGVSYQRRWSYASVVTYVLGEFYWRVEAEQRTEHIDFEGRADGRVLKLGLERTPGETTWSQGEGVSTEDVASAFKLAAPRARQLERGPPPLGQVLRGGGGGSGGGMLTWPVLLLILVIVLVMLSMCGHDSCADEKRAFGANSQEYLACRSRSAAGTGTYSGTGGSWGGFSSGGGGHK